MPAQVRAKFSAVLLAMQARLGDETSVDADQIVIVDDDQTTEFTEEHRIFIRPQGGRLQVPEWEGGNRHVSVLRMVVDIPFAVRIPSGPEPGNDVSLIREDGGWYDLMEEIFDALHGRGLYDGDGTQGGSTNQITADVLQMIDVTRPVGSSRTDNGWTKGTISFAVPYMPILDLSKM